MYTITVHIVSMRKTFYFGDLVIFVLGPCHILSHASNFCAYIVYFEREHFFCDNFYQGLIGLYS